MVCAVLVDNQRYAEQAVNGGGSHVQSGVLEIGHIIHACDRRQRDLFLGSLCIFLFAQNGQHVNGGVTLPFCGTGWIK